MRHLERAGEDGGDLTVPVDRHIEREVRGSQRHRGPDEVVHRVARRVTNVDAASAMRRGWWASRMVSVAARPGHTALGPPLNPAKKWGSTNPVMMRTSAST